MIEVRGLTRRYGRNLALDDVSFEVAPGEVVGFLGPNGAGKSTTMKILTCSVAPTRGTALVAGKDILTDPLGVRRSVGFMPEHVALYPEPPVRDFLKFVADLKQVPPAGLAAHLDAIIDQTGLAEVLHRRVGELSHGYRKRVGLAQALIGDPEVLILDEPTSGLDPSQIVEIRHLIKACTGRRTVLLSSHILTEVGATCQRVLVLDQGKLVGERNAEGLTGAQDDLDQTRSTVLLSWEGDRRAVADALAKVAGVDDLILTDNGAEVSIAGNPVEIRPRLVESVLAAGGRLQNIMDKGPSLEEMFLRLTGAAGTESGESRSDDPEGEESGRPS